MFLTKKILHCDFFFFFRTFFKKSKKKKYNAIFRFGVFFSGVVCFAHFQLVLFVLGNQNIKKKKIELRRNLTKRSDQIRSNRNQWLLSYCYDEWKIIWNNAENHRVHITSVMEDVRLIRLQDSFCAWRDVYALEQVFVFLFLLVIFINDQLFCSLPVVCITYNVSYPRTQKPRGGEKFTSRLHVK